MPDPVPVTDAPSTVTKGATLSPNRPYRYHLYRKLAAAEAQLERYREALERIVEDDGVGDRTAWFKERARQALQEQSDA